MSSAARRKLASSGEFRTRAPFVRLWPMKCSLSLPHLVQAARSSRREGRDIMNGHRRIYIVGGDGAANHLTEEVGRARGYDIVFYDTVEEFLTIANSCDEGCVILLV